jgi:hypothetical protein
MPKRQATVAFEIHRISKGWGVGAGDLKAPALVAYGGLTTPVKVPPPVVPTTSPVVNPWPLIPAYSPVPPKSWNGPAVVKPLAVKVSWMCLRILNVAAAVVTFERAEDQHVAPAGALPLGPCERLHLDVVDECPRRAERVRGGECALPRHDVDLVDKGERHRRGGGCRPSEHERREHARQERCGYRSSQSVATGFKRGATLPPVGGVDAPRVIGC